jgi:hypothetical protein
MPDHHPYSPSKLHRLAACPGSFKLSQGIPEEESEAAAEGTMLHARVASGDLTGLTDEQIEAVNACRAEIASFPGFHEVKLPVFDDLETLTEGTMDYLSLDGDTAYLWDWKFGRGEVAQAAGNYQLAAYALAVHQEYGVSSVRAAIVQPRLRERSDYTFREFPEILRAIRQIRIDCEADGLRLCSGTHCRYCPAAPCLEVNRSLHAVTRLHPSQISNPTQMATMLELAKAIKSQIKAAGEFCDSVTFHALKIPGIPGWRIKDGNKQRALTGLSMAFARCQELNISADEFVGCCEASLPDLEKLAEEKSKAAGGTKKAGKESLLAALADLIEVKPGQPKLVEE